MFKFLKEKLGSLFNRIKKEEEKKEEAAALEERKIEKEIEKLEKKKEEIEEETYKDEKKKSEEEKIEHEIKEKKSIFQKIKEVFSSKLDKNEFDKIWKDLEEILIENNVAMSVIDYLKENLEKEMVEKTTNVEIETILKEKLKENIEKLFAENYDLIEKIKRHEKPFKIVFFGINGSGKTTTIAKLAYLLQKNNLKCVLAAADTFRAASIEQLEKHAQKLGIRLIKHQYGADPTAVAFDAVQHAKAKGIDVVLIDTAGRMHTKSDLMKEMEKIVRVIKPDMRIFVGESITGNDVVEQAKTFNDAIGIDGIILTKADVDERGGAMISVSKITGKPILYLGIGQGYKDLEFFNKDKIIKNIFE